MAGKSIKANYIYSAAYQVLSLITPLITTPYISRVLQPDGIGTYSFAFSVVMYFSFFTSMGTAAYGQREVSYLQDNRKERTRIFWNIKCLTLINVIIFMTAYIILVLIYAGENTGIYIVLSAYILNHLFDLSWLFSGMEEFRQMVIVNIAVRILDIAFTFTFVRHKSDLLIHIGGVVFFNFIAAALLWIYLPNFVDKPEIKSLRPFNDIKIMIALFIPAVAALVYSVLDKTMIGIITGEASENGYYEQAMKIVRLSSMLIVSIVSVMMPRIAYLFGKKDHEQILSYMYASYKLAWLAGIPLCLGLISISDNFVPWFFGSGFEKVSGLLKLSSFLIVASGLNNLTGAQYLIPTKRENTFTFTLITGAAVNFMLNIILIRMFKSYGAVIASVIAESVIAITQLYIVRDELSIKNIFFSGKNYFVSGIIMLIILRYMNSYLYPSMFNTFIMILTGAFVYVIMLLILRDNFFIDYSKRTLKGIASRLHI